MRLFARNGAFHNGVPISSVKELKITPSMLDIGLKLQEVNELTRRDDIFCSILILHVGLLAVFSPHLPV